MTLVLHIDRYWESPYALSAFVALEEKGLAYQLREVALERKEHHAAQYAARTQRIPALVDGDLWLAESSAIAEYLEDMHPAPKYPRIFPQDAAQRAVCREVQAWLRSDLEPIRDERPTTSVFVPNQRATAPLSDRALRASERLVSTVQQLVANGTSTLFDTWCIADTDLAVMLMRLHANGDPLPEACVRYVEAQWARPSVRKWVEHERPSPYVPH